MISWWSAVGENEGTVNSISEFPVNFRLNLLIFRQQSAIM